MTIYGISLFADVPASKADLLEGPAPAQRAGTNWYGPPPVRTRSEIARAGQIRTSHRIAPQVPKYPVDGSANDTRPCPRTTTNAASDLFPPSLASNRPSAMPRPRQNTITTPVPVKLQNGKVLMTTFDPVTKIHTIECDLCGTKISMGRLANSFQFHQHYAACAKRHRVLDSAIGIASTSQTQVENLVSNIHYE